MICHLTLGGLQCHHKAVRAALWVCWLCGYIFGKSGAIPDPVDPDILIMWRARHSCQQQQPAELHVPLCQCAELCNLMLDSLALHCMQLIKLQQGLLATQTIQLARCQSQDSTLCVAHMHKLGRQQSGQKGHYAAQINLRNWQMTQNRGLSTKPMCAFSTAEAEQLLYRPWRAN